MFCNPISTCISTQGWIPWVDCTPSVRWHNSWWLADNTGADLSSFHPSFLISRLLQGSKCGGCTPAETRADTFPVFGLLLNAVHQGIKVRMLIPDPSLDDCAGMISPLPFLLLNGLLLDRGACFISNSH